MDIVEFSKSFFEKSSSAAVADLSVDSNANVRDRSIVAYNYESSKALKKLDSLYLMHMWVKRCFGQEMADKALKKVVLGEVFVNDLTGFAQPYCYAFDLRVMLSEGMNFFHGGMRIKPPKRSDSFIDLIIQSTSYISNQIMGAASFPDFFVVLDYFLRNELGPNYVFVLRKMFDEGLFTLKIEGEEFDVLGNVKVNVQDRSSGKVSEMTVKEYVEKGAMRTHDIDLDVLRENNLRSPKWGCESRMDLSKEGGQL